MFTPDFDNDPRVFEKNAKAVRGDMLDLLPPIQRVDAYADSRLGSAWQNIRPRLDTVIQATKECQTDLSGVIISNYLVVEDDISNPKAADDIVVEFQSGLKTLAKNQSHVDQSNELNALAEEIMQFSKQFDTSVKTKDQAIDAELDASTTQVTEREAEVALLETKTFGDNSDKKSSRDDPSEEERARVEAQLREARQKLSTARDRKIQARAVAEERDRANTPSTVSNLSKAQTTVAMLAAEESRFANTYNQIVNELKVFIAVFEKSRIDKSEETQHALSNQIHKYISTTGKTRAYANALKDAAYNY